jgi:hypothetical protein
LLLAGLRVLQAGLGALHGGGLGAQAFVKIHRIHFAQHLACGDALAHLHRQAQHAPGHRGANVVGGTRFHRANAEQGGRDGALPGRGHRDGHGSERPRAQHHVDEQGQERHHHSQQGQGAALQGKSAHGALRMPRW